MVSFLPRPIKFQIISIASKENEKMIVISETKVKISPDEYFIILAPIRYPVRTSSKRNRYKIGRFSRAEMTLLETISLNISRPLRLHSPANPTDPVESPSPFPPPAIIGI